VRTQFHVASLKKTLRAHYSAPMQTMFRQFRSGIIFFAVGLIIVYLSLTALPPSAKQEFILLCGLIVTAVGFVIAILAHVRMIIARAYRFFKKN